MSRFNATKIDKFINLIKKQKPRAATWFFITGLFAFSLAGANPQLTSTSIGFIAGTWYTAFGFKIEKLSVTAADSNTQVHSTLSPLITKPQYNSYGLDNAIAVATKGSAVNGAIRINYTLTMTLPQVSWNSSTVSDTVTLPIINGQLPYQTIDKTNGNTTCEISVLDELNDQFISLYCWLSGPP